MTIDTIDTIDTEVVDRPMETPDSGSGAAAQRLAELLSPERVDALLADAEASGLAIGSAPTSVDSLPVRVAHRWKDQRHAESFHRTPS
jgi:hypothetical protein